MKINGTKTCSVVFALFGLVSLVCAVRAGVQTYKDHQAFQRALDFTRGLGEGWIDGWPPLGLEKEAQLRQQAAEAARDRDRLTMPYWPPITIFIVSALVCGCAVGLWMQGGAPSDVGARRRERA